MAIDSVSKVDKIKEITIMHKVNLKWRYCSVLTFNRDYHLFCLKNLACCSPIKYVKAMYSSENVGREWSTCILCLVFFLPLLASGLFVYVLGILFNIYCHNIYVCYCVWTFLSNSMRQFWLLPRRTMDNTIRCSQSLKLYVLCNIMTYVTL